VTSTEAGFPHAAGDGPGERVMSDPLTRDHRVL
jgi:hypothetical protein